MVFQFVKRVEEISFEQMQLLGDIELIDVRDLDERKQKHIGGKHIPAQVILKRLHEINTSKPVILYCQAGVRSRTIAHKLAKALPNAKIYSLKGGIVDS